MKTMPKRGETVYWYSYDGSRNVCVVDRLQGSSIVTPSGSVVHYKALQGRLVKKPRPCVECARPRELFYVGHRHNYLFVGSSHEQSGLGLVKETIANGKWNFISTLALIATEENKK